MAGLHDYRVVPLTRLLALNREAESRLAAVEADL